MACFSCHCCHCWNKTLTVSLCSHPFFWSPEMFSIRNLQYSFNFLTLGVYFFFFFLITICSNLIRNHESTLQNNQPLCWLIILSLNGIKKVQNKLFWKKLVIQILYLEILKILKIFPPSEWNSRNRDVEKYLKHILNTIQDITDKEIQSIT